MERKIAACDMNTTFASNTEAERYPGCEAIFEEQSKTCIAFYRQEMAKCDAGSEDAGSEDAGTPGDADTDAATDASLGEECPEGWPPSDWEGSVPAEGLEEWTCEGPIHGQWTMRRADITRPGVPDPDVVVKVSFVGGEVHGPMFWHDFGGCSVTYYSAGVGGRSEDC